MDKVVCWIIILILCFSSIGFCSDSVEEAKKLESLSDYLAYAALNNAGLKAKFENWKAELAQVTQSKSLDDPKFTYGYFIEEVETRVGPQKNKFGIMQKFPWFGEIEARANKASAKAKAARQQYQGAKLGLFKDTKEAYYEFAYLGAAIEIAKENLQLISHFEEVARTKYRSSEASHPDVIRSQIELAKLDDVLKSLQKLKEPMVARLNSILSRKSDAQLEWPGKEKAIKVDIDREEIIGKVVKLNPRLAEIDFMKEAAKAEVELAKKKYYPNVAVGVDWIQTGDAVSPGVSDSGKDPVVLMFSVNLPIWRNSYSAAERQAKSRVRKYQQEKTDARNKMIYKALQLIYDIEDSKRKIDLYSDVLVPKTEELVQSTESAYRAGSVDFLSLIDSQRILLKYQLDRDRAITDNNIGIARLEALVGDEF